MHLIIRNKGDIFEIVNMEIERLGHFWEMSGSKKRVGDWGEKQARDWLIRQGVEVLRQLPDRRAPDWPCKRGRSHYRITG